jgi:hypothetical protein
LIVSLRMKLSREAGFRNWPFEWFHSQTPGERYASSMFPSPNRRLVNSAHSGFVKDWSKDNEESYLTFYVMFVHSRRREKGG